MWEMAVLIFSSEGAITVNERFNTMSNIMKEKQSDIARSEQELAKRKRWTLDIPEIESDPLR